MAASATRNNVEAGRLDVAASVGLGSRRETAWGLRRPGWVAAQRGPGGAILASWVAAVAVLDPKDEETFLRLAPAPPSISQRGEATPAYACAAVHLQSRRAGLREEGTSVRIAVATFGGSGEAHRDGIPAPARFHAGHGWRDEAGEGETGRAAPCGRGRAATCGIARGRESGAGEGEWAFSEKRGRGPRNEWDSWAEEWARRKPVQTKKRPKFCLFINRYRYRPMIEYFIRETVSVLTAGPLR
jgi:hypothetical protein